MIRLGFLFILWIVCVSAFSSDDEQDAYFKSLGFDSYFDDQDSGVASSASNQMVSAILKVDQNPQLFDTVVSSSNNFGLNPIASQSFLPYGRPANLVAQQQPQQANLNFAPNTQRASPLRYDIRTIHDSNYKVYKAEENEKKDNLAPLKKNPADAVYFQPYVNVEVNHPLEYRKEDLTENFEGNQNHKKNPYIAGSARFRRYTGGRSRENLKKAEDEDDDPYNYKAEYISRPKAFDEGPYSSPYKKKKGSKDEYEYPYSYDSGYDHKEYERIKDLSEKQAAEIKQNPENCHEVKKDGMSCMTCKDPKTGGNYESCSYVAEPKNNKYAYSKERKYDSNDDPDEPEQKSDSPNKSEKYHSKKDDSSQKSTEAENEKPYSSYKQADNSDSPNDKYKYSAPQKYTAENKKPYSSYKQADNSDSPNDKYKYTAPQKYTAETEKPYSNYKQADNSDSPNDKYKSYYTHSSQPKKSEALRAASSEESSEEVTPKAYDYKKALPGFYTDNEPKKDVEHVLAEFKKKDRSACKKVQKNGMTCYQCLDKNGLKNEECMFVSESAPKQSHLAYQEHKEFTSKPPTLDGGNEGAESQTVTTNSPPVQKSAASSNYSTKSKRKKAPQTTISEAATNPLAKTAQKVKRSEGSEPQEYEGTPVDISNIAPPEEFAGAGSKGAFWAETLPRYSAALGVTLPEFMLSRSEHEASFDEAVAGADPVYYSVNTYSETTPLTFADEFAFHHIGKYPNDWTSIPSLHPADIFCIFRLRTEMSKMFEEEEYVDVRSLPLKPPQPAPPQDKAVRRVWHPVMWDNSAAEMPIADNSEEEQKNAENSKSREYPHKQRIRNLKRLIAEGKVKPSSETVIFFLCNKFAISEERQSKLS